MPQDTETLLSVKAVAARLGVTAQHVYALIADGLLPASNIGRGRTAVYRIRPAAVDALIDRPR